MSLQLGLARLNKFCEHSSRSNVRILVDAEYTNINPALSLLTLGMLFIQNNLTSLDLNLFRIIYLKGLQKKLNQNESVIWNTIQG